MTLKFLPFLSLKVPDRCERLQVPGKQLMACWQMSPGTQSWVGLLWPHEHVLPGISVKDPDMFNGAPVLFINLYHPHIS
jgi:hypothetical protein